MMDGVNKGSFCGGIPGKEQGFVIERLLSDKIASDEAIPE